MADPRCYTEPMPNVRIARKIRTELGVIIKTELLGSWIVCPEEWPNSPKADYIRRTLSECQQEEPSFGWTLEFQGTDRSWHEEGK